MKRWALAIPGIGFLILIIFVVVFYKGPSTTTITSQNTTMHITSDAFKENERIPARFTCDGEDISPKLTIEEVPEGTQSLALVMDDPDAPNGTFTHWIMWNIDPKTAVIEEGSAPANALEGINGAGKSGYIGPCPPSGEHHYRFQLYALNSILDLPAESSAQDLQAQLQDDSIILAQTQLTGLYQKQNQ